MGQEYGVRRVYETAPKGESVSVRLSDREVQLGSREFALYEKLAERVPSVQSEKEIAADLGMDEARLGRLSKALESAGLLYRQDAVPATLSGVELHTLFNKILPSWLDEAFSHPFWERMTSGKRLAPPLLGLAHRALSLHAERQPPHAALLRAHHARSRSRHLRAKHYAEEWNHYHYFLKSLKALGFTEESVINSVPLPMTLALSNFMRQAAREDILAYSICSAVLEGTTATAAPTTRTTRSAPSSTSCPQESIAPIYAHLDLDVQYQHSDLFLDILQHRRDDPGGARGPRPRLRPPARRAHLAVDRQHREVLRRRVEPDAAPAVRPVPRLTERRPPMTRRQLPVLQAHARRSSRRDADKVAIEYLGEEIDARGRGRAAASTRCCPTSTARPASAASPSGSPSRPARVRALAEQLGRPACSAFKPTTTASAMTGEEFYELHRKLRAPLAAADLRPPALGEDRDRQGHRARRCSASPSRSTTTSRAPTSTWRIAAANATPEMMPHLARHFIEEYNHGDIYRKGLRSLFPDDVVLRAQPLPEHARAGELPQRVGGAQLVRLLRRATSCCR